jgi:uncharacterized low-complexity protein
LGREFFTDCLIFSGRLLFQNHLAFLLQGRNSGASRTSPFRAHEHEQEINMNTRKSGLTLALTAAIGVAGMAQASGNPFAMQSLQQGYQVAAADDKVMEGKCGGAKGMEGKCGGAKDANDKAGAKAKSKEGKCGEGKCGGSKAKTKAMEGKCGGDKAKAMEGKCGGSK